MPKKPHSQFSAPTTESIRAHNALQLASDAGLNSLIERAQWLDQLDHVLRQSLPATLAGQCRLANVKSDTLVFLVNSSVWKDKLRLYADTLLSTAVTAGLTVRALVIKVAPAPPKLIEGKLGKPLSQTVRDSLRATADSLDDPQLRQQLLKLASLP